ALDLALAVHPTPAVCGTPTDEARRVIAGLEGARGFYAGAVGWADASGDGDWMVTIRCAEIDADRRGALTWAGGGLVAGSEPDDEVAETEAKLRTVMRAFGASPTS
ncbi:MAG: chorismate-binding protein, partial [Actinomycetia bacterium]|nr:chorismate-binding protein [Actinomycetes bacterium]